MKARNCLGWTFMPGDRVELHPATDLWMRGARWGTVTRVLKSGFLMVHTDIAGFQRMHPENIVSVEREGA